MPLNPGAGRPPALLVLLWLGTACSSAADPEKTTHTQPAGWADEVALPVATDLNPDPNVLEVNLEAKVARLELKPGVTSELWTYDGGLPGPLLRARVGDRLIVHFKNSLPEPTSMHWHGLRVPNDMDGVPNEPVPPIEPGGSFDYDFVLPDAGTFWYHPHYDSAAQVGYGLYGPLIVDDPDEPGGLGDEAVLVLSDLGINEDGSVWSPQAGGNFGTLFGREGGLMLVNGKVQPTLHVRPGARQRWRLINAAKSRYYALELPGSPFTKLGGDGGFAESPETLERLLLTPAQRADVVLEPTPQDDQSELALRWSAYDRGWGTSFERPDEDVLRLSFEGEPTRAEPLPKLQRDIPAIPLEGARAIDISLTMDSVEGNVQMGINGVPSWKAEHIMTPLGERQLWTVKNTFEFDHPLHLHGYFFQVLDLNGVPPARREWSDTVNVPVDGTVRLAVSFDDRPGMWMFHCHILDHAEAGMMGMLHVQ